ncbi:lysine--tRNA ligase [Candidatus Woesearchaeota archaeon]|nr:lysine--tRNA ligase [Candidatus Woesearchaeota archaeon]
MTTEDDLIAERKKKREEFIRIGLNPYPYSYSPTHHSSDVHTAYQKLKPDEKSRESVTVAGRVVGLRRMGKATFLHLLDEKGKLQAYFKYDAMPSQYDNLRLVDRGDWIGIEGTVFKTKTGEVTVNAARFEMLCKSLRPLPEKWHGLKDIEQRYRKRYVDLVMNPEARDAFVKRTRIIDTIRHELNTRNFLEVETPIIQAVYGGANAKPFKTFLNSLKMNVFMRISNELYLKRLVVGGFERVYEFAKDFRNEDIDRTHNPEFTQVEIYQAYADYHDMKEIVMDLYVAAAKALHGSTQFEYGGAMIDVKKPWKSYTVIEALDHFAGIKGAFSLSEKKLAALCKQHKADIPDSASKGQMIQALFEELVEHKLIQPTFITHHPIESTPLCKPCREEPLSKHFIERFEPFIAGMEIANAYSELNDPVLQRTLLEGQAQQLRAGSEEAHPMDEDFVQAIEHGMPPTGGVGIGIDRMTMILTNNTSIRDVIFFPFMKPE